MNNIPKTAWEIYTKMKCICLYVCESSQSEGRGMAWTYDTYDNLGGAAMMKIHIKDWQLLTTPSPDEATLIG